MSSFQFAQTDKRKRQEEARHSHPAWMSQRLVAYFFLSIHPALPGQAMHCLRSGLGRKEGPGQRHQTRPCHVPCAMCQIPSPGSSSIIPRLGWDDELHRLAEKMELVRAAPRCNGSLRSCASSCLRGSGVGMRLRRDLVGWLRNGRRPR